MKNTYKILAAFALGAVAGGVIGILFAPDKGSETRLKMNEKGKKVAHNVNELMVKGKEKFNSLKDTIRQMQMETEEERV